MGSSTSASDAPELPAQLAVKRHRLPAWLRVLRPRQWTKNLAVFAPLLFARRFFDGDAATRELLAFVAFCLLSSGTYVFNDWIDREEDRRHPEKALRPIAAREIRARTVLLLIIICWAAGLDLGAHLGWKFAALGGVYLARPARLHLRLQAPRHPRRPGDRLRIRAPGAGRRGGHRRPGLRLALPLRPAPGPVPRSGQAATGAGLAQGVRQRPTARHSASTRSRCWTRCSPPWPACASSPTGSTPSLRTPWRRSARTGSSGRCPSSSTGSSATSTWSTGAT